MANKVDTWKQLMSAAVSMPRIKVNREKFLTKVLTPYCNAEKLSIAIKGMPANVVPLSVIDRLALAVINNHTMKVTGASVITGLGGMTTVPADIIQYYWHVFVLSQKLTYLYGFPDLCDEEGEMPEESQDLLTVFVAIMMGATMAGKGLQVIIECAAKQTTKKLPEMVVAEALYYPIVRQASKWIGRKLAKNNFARGMGKSIPLFSSLLSGVISFATFRPGALRLRNELRKETALLQEKEMAFISRPKAADDISR